jgi:ribosome-interacting GTPase 1
LCTSSASKLSAVLTIFSRRKLARLRAQLLEPAPGAGSGGGSGFDVSKSGDARIALVGFPSVVRLGPGFLFLIFVRD